VDHLRTDKVDDAGTRSGDLFDVAGRLALITGSSRGIGRALAEGLLNAGATVVLNGRDSDALERTRATLQARSGARVHGVCFDATDAAAVNAGIDHIERTAGPLDILVNNAGVQRRGAFTEFSDDDWHTLLDTNVTSAFLVGRAVAQRMVSRGVGKIVNVCSLQSEVSRPGIAAYAATKGAIKMLTKGMCADLAGHGICVNGLGPGYFETEMTASLVGDAQFSDWVRSRTPSGRWGQLADLVGPLLFLCSPAADFVNGQILYVDGGMLSIL
jgi:gluconate 5-dehydrogenase